MDQFSLPGAQGKVTWDADDLAVVLKKTRPVIHRMLRHQPEALPAPCRRIGKCYLWLPGEVMAWLRGAPAGVPEQTTPKRGRGRPRKDAKQNAGGAA